MVCGYSKPLDLADKCYPAVVESLPKSLAGKNILITGTTSGTGYIASKVCAERGANVIMLNRKSKRAEDALKSLEEEVGSAGTFDWIECDLQDLESVRQAAEIVKGRYEYLDVLALNAGVMALEDVVTKDGYDIQMQTNVISHFLLTKELLPLLEAGAEKHGSARVVNHSSIARFGSKLQKKYFAKHKNGELGGNFSFLFTGARWKRYQQTKLACAVFHGALTAMLEKKQSKVISLLAHPGLANTNLQVTTNKDGGMGGMFSNILMRFGQSQKDGASPLIMCIASENVQNGDFFGPGQGQLAMKGTPKKLRSEKAFTNKECISTFWTSCEDAVGKFSV